MSDIDTLARHYAKHMNYWLPEAGHEVWLWATGRDDERDPHEDDFVKYSLEGLVEGSPEGAGLYIDTEEDIAMGDKIVAYVDGDLAKAEEMLKAAVHKFEERDFDH